MNIAASPYFYRCAINNYISELMVVFVNPCLVKLSHTVIVMTGGSHVTTTIISSP